MANNSISSLVEQFMRLQKNSLEVIAKLSEVATSSADTVQFNLMLDDGTTKSVQIPSFGFMNNKIDRVDNNVQQLAGLSDSSSTIKMPDGTTKTVFQASIMRDPAPVTNLQVPSNFKIRNNWFFESFLSPLLYVSFDVTGKVPDNMRKAVVKRFIANCDTQDKKDFFDNNFKGKNDVDYADFLNRMSSAGIVLFTDEENVELPTSVMRFRGTFDVLKVSDETVNITSNNTTVAVKKRKYKLNKLTYTDILSGTVDSKTLQLNDKVLTGNGSTYVVESIDSAENTVVFKRISGSQPIALGTDVISIYSSPYSIKEIQVNIGYNERQVIFLKPIDYDFEIASSQYSPGIGFFSNEMIIALPNGNQTLETFYKEQVTDFGQIFINAAKDKQIPAVQGITPESPTLDVTNFKVMQINTHKKDTKEIDDIKQKLANKVSLQNEISQLAEAIDNKKNDLNNNSNTKSDAEKRKIKADLETLAKEKNSKTNLYSSLVKEIATKTQENPAVLESAKYRVRGFWPIPNPKPSAQTQDQEIIQFRVSYRYVRKDGNAPGTEQMEFTDTDGTKKRGYFSNWNEYKSDIRKKKFNTTTGFYEWTTEDVSDADSININQLDISISKNEQVQIRVKSISEAGFPLNPLESEWSNVITVDFPNDLQIADDTASLLSDASRESQRVSFQEELNSRGLDLHLLNSFTSGDKYYTHVAADISSDFYTPEGKVINLYEKLKSIDDELKSIKALIEKAKGSLAVFLVDDTGNVTKITQNSTTKLFAGFYKDLIASGSGVSITYNHGQVITKNYILRIENSAATDLELSSLLPGGIAELVPTSNPLSPVTSPDYDKNRRYDLVPVSITGASSAYSGDAKQVSPFQSRQVKSLWLYSRKKSTSLDEDLYSPASAFNPNGINPSYSYNGVSISGYTYPLNGPHLLPFSPNLSINSATQNINVWNGVIASFTSQGNGYLTEFCIHKDHPDIHLFEDSITGNYNLIADTSKKAFKTPDLVYNSSASKYTMQYPKFAHSIFFSDDNLSQFGKKQVEAITPGVPAGNSPTTVYNDTYLPPKLGFTKNDEYLIGKHTCGAYLYIAPIDYTDIAVEGSTDLAKKMLQFGEDKAINIPLIFQFRCSDKLEFIGGFRQTGKIANVEYIKKLGIDIQVRGESLFSFDVEVSCKYSQDSLVKPIYVPNLALDRLVWIRNPFKSPFTRR